MSFADRLALAMAHEGATCELVQAAGWACGPFGQGQLHATMRDALRSTKSPMRWMPDLLAVRGQEVLLIDAKTEQRTDTPNFSLEKAAHAAHLAWWTVFGVPIVYVWADFRVNWANHLTPKITGPWYGSGSGTSYWLIPKAEQLPFEAIFCTETKEGAA